MRTSLFGMELPAGEKLMDQVCNLVLGWDTALHEASLKGGYHNCSLLNRGRIRSWQAYEWIINPAEQFRWVLLKRKVRALENAGWEFHSKGGRDAGRRS